MNSKKLAEGMLLWAKKPIHTSLTKMDDNEARKLAPKVRKKEEGGGRGRGRGTGPVIRCLPSLHPSLLSERLYL